MENNILTVGLCTTEHVNKYVSNGKVINNKISIKIDKFGDPDELFRTVINTEKYDVAELSMSSYFFARSAMSLEYTAIPIFPSRKFRLSDIFVNDSSSIKKPENLNGKSVLSFPSYYVTASVWQRGILSEYYDVDISSIKWFASKPERFDISYPSKIIVSIDRNMTMDVLSRNVIDCIIGPLKPPDLKKGVVKRIFENPATEELQYFKQTGIFPIMHVIVIRNSIIKNEPELVKAIYLMFEESKEKWIKQLDELPAYLGGIPFYDLLIDEFFRNFGVDIFEYGYKKNRKTIEKLYDYCRKQVNFHNELSINHIFYVPFD
jgi:4,5-dihydroxyphthalate decarboxylase